MKTRARLLPHRTTQHGVLAEPWTVMVDGQSTDPSTAYDLWDRVAPIELSGEAAVDLDAVRSECGLSPESRVALVAVWHADATNVRRLGVLTSVTASQSHRLTFELPADLLDGSITITRSLVLHQGVPNQGDSVASRIGSVLWREAPGDRTVVVLDRPADRVAVDAVDFDAMELEADGAWSLQADLVDLDARASHALRLLVNRHHPDIAALLADDDDTRVRAVRSVLRWDVGRQLLDQALDTPAFDAGFGSYARDSVGGVLQQLLQRWLPGLTPSELRSARAKDRAGFEAMVQARLELLRWT